MSVNNKSYCFLCILFSLFLLGCQKAENNNYEELDPLSLVLRAKQVFSENNSYIEFQDIRQRLSDLAEDAQNLPPEVQQEICHELESSSDEVLSNFQEFLEKAELTCSLELLDRIDHFREQNLSDDPDQEQIPVEQTQPIQPPLPIDDPDDNQEQVPVEPTQPDQVPLDEPQEQAPLTEPTQPEAPLDAPEDREQIPTEQPVQSDCVDQNGNFQMRYFPIHSESYIDGRDFPDGHLALTFDDGPRNDLTLRLLDILDARGAKVTFFMVGRNVERLPDIVLQVADRGHSIGSHSYRHEQLNRMSTTDALDSILKGRDILSDSLANHTSVRPFFRFPFGELTPSLKDAVLENGLSVFSWNMDPRDWAISNPSRLGLSIWRQIEQANYSGILLFHELEQTIAIMPWLLQRLANAGLCLVLFH